MPDVLEVPQTVSEASMFLQKINFDSVDVEDVKPIKSLRKASLILTRSGKAVFIKQFDESLKAEDDIYDYIGKGVFPEYLEGKITRRYDHLKWKGVRVYEGFAKCKNWDEHLRVLKGYSPQIAYKFGIELALLHNQEPIQEHRQNQHSKLQRNRIRDYSKVTLKYYANAPGFQMRDFLIKAQNVSGRISRLSEQIFPQIIIHGDLKIDNILIRDDEFFWIDWELCGFGEAMCDLGTLVGSVISAWFGQVKTRKGMPLEYWFGHATIPSTKLVSCLENLLAGYQDQSKKVLDNQAIERLWSYAGYFLLERGYVANWLYGRFNLSTRLEMEMGEKILENPELGSHLFLNSGSF